ncbi:Golgi membrane protein 1 isoform X1 [Oncorhynchus mykiss]|uniref:Golgi membrane protein 1 isoform X1 n=1 Tax=Oncorhynchus mykiss TaxID=8022 RepID=UPI001878CCCD|nr:Golgi membrane protein 1 isoform X1 [Oncorhynchus mykiss]
MGGLGNGRRGGRSPPLMIGALIACVLVLGFNYWVSNSRNLELQTKLYELEAQMRRAASERGAVEVKKNEFQEEIQRLKEESSRMQSLNKRLEGVHNTCSQEKASQLINISSSTKVIQDLKSQLNELNEDLGKVQKEFQSCQGNLNTLNKKLTYDMTQCNTQILAQREDCAEKVAAAKREVQKKLEMKNPAVSSQTNAAPTQKISSTEVGVPDKEGPGKAGLDDTKTTPVHSHAPEPSAAKGPAVDLKTSELETNEIAVDKALDTPALSRKESLPSADAKGDQPGPVEGASKPRKNNLTEDTELEVMDTHGGEPQIEEADPGADDIQLSQWKEEEAPIGQEKVEDPEEDYDADKPIVGGVDPDQRNQMAVNIDKEAEREMQEELADYNGDDENEGEFEADKQAELAQF